ncbi:hypothetical protein ACN28I_39160 [Archangium gephyra]|uniref:hypothetical protein n=1 Tax=Archangium gephyra TaxID=48 RepID=UPI003B8094B5
MRRFPSLLLPLSLGLVLAAASCDPDEPGDGSGNDAGMEEPLPDAGGDAGEETDAGLDAGTEADAGTEEPGEPCTLTDPQPSMCGYGSFCGASSTCQTVPAPTCENFNKFPVSWDPATSSGPVIYGAELLSFAADATNCFSGRPMRIRTRIRAYSPSGRLPTTPSELAAVFSYVRPDGSSVVDASQYSNVVTSGDLTHTEFEVRVCVSDLPTVNLGFYFEEGNGYCQTATR